MERRKIISVFAFFTAGIMVPAHGQNPTSAGDTLKISLAEAWQKAEAHSRMINVKIKAAAVANEENKDARTERFPEVSVAGSVEKASNIPVYDNGIFSRPSQHEVIHTLYHVGADFYLNLYNGNMTNLGIAATHILHQISLIQKDQTIADIRYKTASLYLELQRSLIFKDLIIQDIADQEKQLQEISSFHKNGTVLKSDVLRVQLDLSKRRMTLVTIENDILIVRQKLNIIIGAPDNEVVIPTVPSGLQDDGLTYDQYLTAAFQHSFPYFISEKQTALSEIRLKQAKANYKPKLGMYGDFYYANPQIFLYPYNPYWYSLGVIGLKASIPLSSVYHNVHKVRAAAIELEKEEELHRDTEDKVRQQVNEAFLRYKEALVQIDVAEVNVTQALENARIIKNTYFSQTSLITDLLDADVQVLQTRFELAAARILAQDKYYLLRNITGIL